MDSLEKQLRRVNSNCSPALKGLDTISLKARGQSKTYFDDCYCLLFARNSSVTLDDDAVFTDHEHVNAYWDTRRKQLVMRQNKNSVRKVQTAESV